VFFCLTVKQSELKSIVSKRKKFEYKLKSKGATLEYFMRYIEYEMRLDKLRLLRLELAGATRFCGPVTAFVLT
jgi:hypothetical protein